MSLVFLPTSAMCAFVAALCFVASKSLPDIFGTPPPAEHQHHYAPVARVTLGWLCLYYAFLFFQSATKFAAHDHAKRAAATAKKQDAAHGALEVPSFGAFKYGNAGGRFTLTGERTAVNMLEQSVPFLGALWLHAVCISPSSAAQIGWCWLLFRAMYPAAFWMGIPILFVSTLPGYACINALVVPVAILVLS
eukprot:TRINITY_DN1906_c0_g1_i1.p1 TRINITY_DN1906_c0_g1~~TRINITY_DN1906_c0_g1_i1.p1  ORF type:complete len:192 (+),score=40.85 TRINITY_DN1906_c0_g1_i1:368-943(+)